MFYLLTFVVATSRIMHLVSYYFTIKDPKKYVLAKTFVDVTDFIAFYGNATLWVF